MNQLHDPIALLGRPPIGGERDDVSHDFRGVGRVVHERLRADRDFVAEERGDFVGVAGAADVPEQRSPVCGLAHLPRESRGLAHPRREETRPQL